MPGIRYQLTTHAVTVMRVLRVVYNASVDPLRVITAYFDRRQKGKL